MSLLVNLQNLLASATQSTQDAQSPLAGAAGTANHAKLKEAAKQFEAIMLSQLTSSLKVGTDSEGSLFGSGQSDMVQKMFGEQMATALASGGGVGLANLITNQLEQKGGMIASAVHRAKDAVRQLRDVAASVAHSSAEGGPSSTTSTTASSSSKSNSPNNSNQPAAAPNAVSTSVAIPGLSSNHPVMIPPTAATNGSPISVVNSASGFDEALRNVTRPRRVSDLAAPGQSNVAFSVVALPPVSDSVIHLPSGAKHSSTAPAIAANSPASASSGTLANSGTSANGAPTKISYTGHPKVDAIIQQASERYGVDPRLIAAVMQTESSVEPNAVSSKGAAGYMQVMPATFREFAGPGKNIFDPQSNIEVGAAYLQFLSNKYDGSLDKVLASYNAGTANVDKYGGVPPFKETRNFVASVKRQYEGLQSASKEAASTSVAANLASTNVRTAQAGGIQVSTPHVASSTVVGQNALNTKPVTLPLGAQSNPVSPVVNTAANVGAPASTVNQGAMNHSSARVPGDTARVRAATEATPIGTSAHQYQVKQAAYSAPSASTAAPSASTAAPVDLHLPVHGRISSPFGARRGGGHHHNGVDIAAPKGTPIQASASGQVVFAGWTRGYGNNVLIEHPGGTYTRYAHAEHLFVAPGETIQAGQPLGTVGATGHATGPHLHFEVIQGGHHVNPLQAINGETPSTLAALVGK